MYAMFVTNNHASFHLWWKENLVKHQEVSKYYVHDCGYFLIMIKILDSMMKIKLSVKSTCEYLIQPVMIIIKTNEIRSNF